MKFEIDSGNTRIKWRCVDDLGVVVGRGAVTSVSALTLVVEKSDFKRGVAEVLISTVASQEIGMALERFARQSFGSKVRVFFARSESVLAGVKFAYQDVSRLGVDRCLVMVAGYARSKSGVLVVDCGSAITADYVSSEGEHLGGYIFPGLNMLRTALLGRTANILAKGRGVGEVSPGDSTDACVNNGAAFMFSSLGRGLLEEMSHRGISSLVVTGGDGEALAAHLERGESYVEDLVFEGLELVSG